MHGTSLDPEWDARLPGLARLRALTIGEAGIRVAVLDGPIDPADGPHGLAPSGVAEHGTLVGSIVAGSRRTDGLGIAPGCTLLSIPVFETGPAGETLLCSQETLATAILRAVRAGSHIINISASQQADLLSVSTALSAALQEALAADILVVAVAGNEGCACDAIPASVPGVLPVGAHDEEGRPLARSNWGSGQRAGLLAPGQALPGACVGGGVCRGTGTSFAAALVSGVAALLMSLELARGGRPSGTATRRLLIDTADSCPVDTAELCSPYLAGRLNTSRLADRVLGTCSNDDVSEAKVTTTEMLRDTVVSAASATPLATPPQALNPACADSTPSTLGPAHEGCACGGKCSGGKAGGCACGGGAAAQARPQLVYATGRLGISFPSATRRDAIWRSLHGTAAASNAEIELKPIMKEPLVELFRREPWHAQSVIWTISRTEVPMYAILPSGAFGAETYQWLVDEWADEHVEFISLPGVVAGPVTLYDGQSVDAVLPDMRGMYSWNTRVYVDALLTKFGGLQAGQDEAEAADANGAGDARTKRRLDRFLRKIQFSIRNRGLLPQERAINAAATNAFNLSDVIVQAGEEGLALRDISAERSPLNRPGSDYYDVLFTFFDPTRRQDVSPLVARFTIDVSDTVPVVVGEPVTWYDY